MQLTILLKKDLTSLFKQKAVIATLLIPMFLIMGIGILPSIIGVDQPFDVYILNEDEGDFGVNIGASIEEHLLEISSNNSNVKMEKVDTYQKFQEIENGVFIPKNFTKVAINSNIATYYLKKTDSDLRASSVMDGIVKKEIENIILQELLNTTLPKIKSERIFSADQLTKDGERQNRSQIAHPLAYMAFLILLLSSSSMRISGFTAERESGMMELLLASVIDRREMILSKLITGVVYGLATVLSYVVGILIVFLFQGNVLSTEEASFIIIPADFITVKNIFIIIFLFVDLAFIAIQILLTIQLVLGRDAGDRLGSMVIMILAFMFYFSSIGDPLSQSSSKTVNPFFWPYRITLNLIFQINVMDILTFLFLNLIFCWYLLNLKTNAIEQEKVLFE